MHSKNAILLSELQWRAPFIFFEYAGDVAAVLESDFAGEFDDRAVCGDQQVGEVFDAVDEEVLVERGPGLLFKAHFEISPGQRHRFDQSLHTDLLGIVVVDEPDDFFHMGIRDIVDAGGLPLDDPYGVDHDIKGEVSPAGEHSVEKFAGLIASVFDIEGDGGDRWIGDTAQQVVVVHAQQ